MDHRNGCLRHGSLVWTPLIKPLNFLTCNVSTTYNLIAALHGSDEVAVHGHIAVGHARRVERKAGIAVAVEQDEAPPGLPALAKKGNGFPPGQIGAPEIAGIGCPPH